MELLQAFLHLEPLSQLIIILAIVAMYYSLNSYLFPYKKPKDPTKKYEVEIKDMKGKVHVKDKWLLPPSIAKRAVRVNTQTALFFLCFVEFKACFAMRIVGQRKDKDG